MDAVLQTKRLLLRRARLSDRDAYLELRNSPYVMDCNPMAPITPEQAERQLEKDLASGRAFYLEERATGLLAGVVWLSPDSLRYQMESLSLEYFVGEAFAGRGLMTEALGAVRLPNAGGAGAFGPGVPGEQSLPAGAGKAGLYPGGAAAPGGAVPRGPGARRRPLLAAAAGVGGVTTGMKGAKACGMGSAAKPHR